MSQAALHIGTSGFSYQDWVGHFYPKGTKKADFCAYYSNHFQALDVNYTYYRMPTRRTMSSLIEKSEEKVTFAVKLTGVFTHERTGGAAEAKEFGEAVEPMAERGVLGCLPGLLPELKVVTSPVGYVRFHVRNRAKWWTHDRPEERYDYLYASEELAAWGPGLNRMREASDQLFVFFNNHFEGKAVANAFHMRELLTP